jgi:hypothetical protein
MHKEARYVEERDPAAVGRAHQLVPVPRVPLPVGGLEHGEKRRRLRRGRERQQLLPEHEVLPHPAPDDVAEPTARPSAYPSAQRPASKVPYLVRSRAMSREYGWAEWISCSG